MVEAGQAAARVDRAGAVRTEDDFGRPGVAGAPCFPCRKVVATDGHGKPALVEDGLKKTSAGLKIELAVFRRICEDRGRTVVEFRIRACSRRPRNFASPSASKTFSAI